VVCNKPLAGPPSVTSPQTSRNNRVGRLKVAAFVTGTRKGLGPPGPGTACVQAPARPASVHRRASFSHPPVSLRHALDEGPHLLRRHAGAARLDLNLYAVRQRDAAPHLHHAGLDGARGRFFWRTRLQLSHALQAKASIRPAADQQQLLQVAAFSPPGPYASELIGAAACGHPLRGTHSTVIQAGLNVLRRQLANDQAIEGYRKDGPVSVAKFELGEGPAAELREARVLRQRQASDLLDRLLAGIG
jgi:hypothetical protein